MEGAGKKYKGVRRRRWGKYVSEIRVPSSRERLWLGSYSTPEAAAVAHDTAVYLLRGPSSSRSLSFPQCVPTVGWSGGALSPRSVQRVASDSGMAVDAGLVAWRPGVEQRPLGVVLEGKDEWEAVGRSEQRHEGEPLPRPLDISVDDMEICL